MADNNRPQWMPGSTSGQNDDPVVDGNSVTPVEGLDTRSVPSLPVRPEQVLELLKARLALAPAPVQQLSHPEPLYFPPMKPPGPSQHALANEPLVLVVPDCNVRIRTQRKLRGPSGRPVYAEDSERRNRTAVIVLIAAGLAIALMVGIARERSIGQSHPANGSIGELSAHPVPSPLRIDESVRLIPPKQVAPAPLLDSGTVSARANASIHPSVQSASRGQKVKVPERDGGGARSQALGRDGLVF